MSVHRSRGWRAARLLARWCVQVGGARLAPLQVMRVLLGREGRQPEAGRDWPVPTGVPLGPSAFLWVRCVAPAEGVLPDPGWDRGGRGPAHPSCSRVERPHRWPVGSEEMTRLCSGEMLLAVQNYPVGWVNLV